ncbi:MAG TPA: hypothetical protein VKX35_11210 [Fermentimonas sp.]|nr:hypothetical protein [Fermentimonas sp.]
MPIPILAKKTIDCIIFKSKYDGSYESSDKNPQNQGGYALGLDVFLYDFP